MHMRWQRFVVTVAVLASLVVGVGCGGGGGGGGGGPTLPGTLAAVALQGAATPAGGTYGGFVPDTKLAAADGGWVAFVADVVGGSTSRGLFVVRPNGTVVLVYSDGETVPNTNGGSGTIDDFERIWIRPGGLVVAHVSITGGSTEGFVTARVDNNGNVVEKAGAVYLGRTLPNPIPAGTTGTLVAIDEDATQVDDQADIFFHGTGSNGGLHGVFTSNRAGTNLARIAISGETVPAAGTFGFDFPAIGIDQDGALVAFAASLTTSPSEAIFATFDGVGFIRLAANGETPPASGARAFDDVYADGPLHVTYAGGQGAAYVTWRGSVTGSTPEHGIYSCLCANGGGLALGAVQAIVGPNTVFTEAGLGIITNVALYETAVDPTRVSLSVDLAGGSTSRLFLSAVPGATFAEIFRQGASAPGGSTFALQYPSLLLDGVTTDRTGSFGFTATLTDNTSGLFWAIFGVQFFVVAKDGDTAAGTGGGVFAAFSSPSAVAAAVDTLAFRAFINGGTATTGIFRQG